MGARRIFFSGVDKLGDATCKSLMGSQGGNRRRHACRQDFRQHLLVTAVQKHFTFPSRFLYISSIFAWATPPCPYKNTYITFLHSASRHKARGVGWGGGEPPLPKLSKQVYTPGRVCLKHPNKWYSVMFGKYRRAFSATGVT